MKYKIETTPKFDKEFKKLDNYTKRMIKAWIDKNLVNCDNPRQHGKGLTANRSGQWRYRIGDYRLICIIEDDKLIITALNIGHRRDIYYKVFAWAKTFFRHWRIYIASCSLSTDFCFCFSGFCLTVFSFSLSLFKSEGFFSAVLFFSNIFI